VETTATANSLNVGIHGVTVTDAKECKITVSVTITEPTLLTASAVQVSPVVCFGESNGSATVTLLVEMEHIPIYGITVKLRLRLILLNVGAHDVTVTDAKECKITVSVTITEPTLLTASAVQVSPVVLFWSI
jgi:hypothetical protein